MASQPDPTTEAFRAQIAAAARRYRLERLATGSVALAWSAAVGLLIVLVAGLVFPEAWFLPFVAAILIGACAVAGMVIYLSRFDSHRLRVRMDSHAKLPDSVLSTGDWENASLDPWREQQRRQTLSALENLSWPAAWPVRWPRKLRVPVLCTLVLVLGVALISVNGAARARATMMAERAANAPVAKEQLKPLEDVFKDWEEAQKIAPSPEMEKLLKELQPLREQMAQGKLSQKDLLLKLNDVQARLQSEQDKLEASSLDDLAKPMAEAMKDLDAMSGASAALQRQDFEGAKEQAQQAAQKYNSGEAKMPQGDNAQSAANKMGAVAQQAASKNPDASNAMKQMQQSLSNKDSNGMCKGLQNLSQSLAKAGQCKSQSHNLSLQMAQLSQCKNGMCNGKGITMGMPQLSLSKSLAQQHGAGTKTDPNHTGAQTSLDGSHQQVNLTGTAGNGPSETHTESTTQPQFEQTASGVRTTDFSQYQKLSEQAMEDENLPIGQRQVIKRYFENIHPQDAR